MWCERALQLQLIEKFCRRRSRHLRFPTLPWRYWTPRCATGSGPDRKPITEHARSVGPYNSSGVTMVLELGAKALTCAPPPLPRIFLGVGAPGTQKQNANYHSHSNRVTITAPPQWEWAYTTPQSSQNNHQSVTLTFVFVSHKIFRWDCFVPPRLLRPGPTSSSTPLDTPLCRYGTIHRA